MFLQQEKGTSAPSANAELRYLVKPTGFVQEQVPGRFHPQSQPQRQIGSDNPHLVLRRAVGCKRFWGTAVVLKAPS